MVVFCGSMAECSFKSHISQEVFGDSITQYFAINSDSLD